MNFILGPPGDVMSGDVYIPDRAIWGNRVMVYEVFPVLAIARISVLDLRLISALVVCF